MRESSNLAFGDLLLFPSPLLFDSLECSWDARGDRGGLCTSICWYLVDNSDTRDTSYYCRGVKSIWMVFIGLSPKTLIPFFKMFPAAWSLMVLFDCRWVLYIVSWALLPRAVKGVCLGVVYKVDGVSIDTSPWPRYALLGVVTVATFDPLDIRSVSLNQELY